MNQQLLSEIGRTQRLEILNTLKRTKGLSVNELVGKMKMSYMGIKQHCLTLERDGYLDTWRRPQKMGRPEMVYRLTRRTHDLFPCDSNDFTLELLKSIKEVYGPNAPEKMLFNVFERKTAALKAKVKGETVAERAKWLASQREKEGFMSQFVRRRKGRRAADSGMPFADPESARSIPDYRPPRAGLVRRSSRHRVRREETPHFGLVRVRLLFLSLICSSELLARRIPLSHQANFG